MKRPTGPRKTANLSESIHRQLDMYAVAAGTAGVGLLALAPSAEARIIYTPADVNLQFHNPFPLDLNHDGKIDMYLVLSYHAHTGIPSEFLSACHAPYRTSRGLSYCLSRSGSNSANAVRILPSGGAAALRAGAKIQRGYLFRDRFAVAMGGVQTISSHVQWRGAWVNGGKGVKNRYLGLKFKINGRFHYGWARLTVTTQPKSFTATLTGYAYESIAGKGIIAGKTKGPEDASVEESNATPTVPAPVATLGMLALGERGLSIWRREESVGATQ
jgi:hypothetical protein